MDMPNQGARGEALRTDSSGGTGQSSVLRFRPVLEESTRADLMAKVAALESRLQSLPAIEQAKGALMATYGISADAAFALLRFHSQTRNVKVRAIAAELTALMSSSPTSSAAITRFDRRLEEVARSLQPTAASAAPKPVSPAGNRAEAGGRDMAPDELTRVMLRSVATVPPGITIAHNAPGVPLVYANEAFTEITGYRMGEILGRNCRFLQGVDTDPRDVAALAGGMRTGRDVSVVLRNYRRDGSPFWNEVSVSPIRDRADQITHFVGTQIDVTDWIDNSGSRRAN